MFRRILLCYDGSREGRNALRRGAEVALAMRAEAHLLAVVRDTTLVPPEGVVEAALPGAVQAEETILREGVQWLKAQGLEAHGRVVHGDAVRSIASCARELGADLIVLGHRPRSALARWWSDDESATLLESSPCSVLVACEPAA